jgi:hypothetical protein
MQVTQYGLQEAFKRARQQIFIANLPEDAQVTGYMTCSGGASQAQAQAAANAAQNAVLSQSYLRLIQQMTTNLNLFNFPVQVDQPTVNPGEVRLQKQDALFASSMAFYLAKGGSATDVSYKPQTYPNATTWPTGSGAGGLDTIYNGSLILTINKSVILPNYSMRAFRQVPQTQNGVGVTAQTVFPIDQFDPSAVALWEPTINLIGTKQNVWQLALPANMTATIEATTWGIFDIFGVLAQNVTLFT